MNTRERIFDYSFAEELLDGTARYWMEDQWRDARRDVEFGLVKRSPRYRGQLEKHLLSAGEVFWLVAKVIVVVTWQVLKITWMVLQIAVIVFCFQSLLGSVIALSRK